MLVNSVECFGSSWVLVGPSRLCWVRVGPVGYWYLAGSFPSLAPIFSRACLDFRLYFYFLSVMCSRKCLIEGLHGRA